MPPENCNYIAAGLIFMTLFFTSCLQKKEKDEIVLIAIIYRFDKPFCDPDPPIDKVIELIVRINICYDIKSNRLLNINDILVEKTGNLLDTLKMICTDTIYNDTINQPEYYYECRSNKYLDVVYICSNHKSNDLKEYYYKVKDVIKDTELFFNGDTLKKRDKYREIFVTDENWRCGIKFYDVDDIDNWTENITIR